ncbi:zinc finger protein [Scheffersomyces stipitis CBS 6054]|uniref:Zinc finger protein n=1 Tax=Scheffersomyces stipitis (strain ATCC 58785 / CBS 6054 / NBRC 10063 / NRRL Y-11545) TaxID=322104 RepID=A3LU38_PICST|nr:zinc finger protein [Scheffersomyces stipitis CBS 6054]ABN66518.2 zinc finger protein [Scheffersomyces stipitis CBS 6054]
MSHRSNALPSSKKTHSEKHKQILKQLLKETPNRSCADCKTAKNPRWASWSLGCFICIRCSGIHRSMGTHISKVKSVDLDAWTDDQIENMVLWGNDKCNTFWEAKLPDSYIPDSSKIESFIRTKYDIKKWAASSHIPDPLSIKVSSGTTSTTAVQPQASKMSQQSSQTSSISDSFDLLSSSNHSGLLEEDFGAFTSSPSPKPQLPEKANNNGNNSNNSNNSLKFPIATVQSAQSTGGSINGRPDLKKSILSLYSSPSASTSFIPQQPRLQTPGQIPSSINGLGNSLSGLNLGSRSTPASPPLSLKSANVASGNSGNIAGAGSGVSASTNDWKNEWSDSNSSVSNKWNQPATTGSSSSANDLDNELFKNVWS